VRRNGWMARARHWLARKKNSVLDHAAVTLTGHCRHKTHGEMLAARSHCPDCRRRYVRWAISAGLDFNPERDGSFSEWARHGRND
jgi:hypothetical protein